MTDYLKNIGNRYLPSLSLIRSVCSFNIRSVAQWDIVVSTYLQMVQQLQTGTHINIWGIERSGFFNGREKWAKGFENQRV